MDGLRSIALPPSSPWLILDIPFHHLDRGTYPSPYKMTHNPAYGGDTISYSSDNILSIVGDCTNNYWASNSYTTNNEIIWEYGQTRSFTKIRMMNNSYYGGTW